MAWSVVTAVACVAVFLMFLTVTLDVALRYLAGGGIRGVNDLVATWWMVPIAIIGLGVAQRGDSQIRVDFVVDLLSPRLRRVVDTAALALVACFSIAVAYLGLREALVQLAIGEYAAVGNIPLWPVRFVIPVGFLAVAVAAIATAVRGHRGGGSRVQ